MVASHTSTLFARSSARLLSQLSDLSLHHHNHVLIYALSSNAPDLEQIVSRLSALCSESIGCLSSPLPQRSSQAHFSCSLAVFPRDHCVPFRSTIPGEQPLQVGRYHAFRKATAQAQPRPEQILDSDGDVDWEAVWSKKHISGVLPPEINALNDVHSFVYFSDDAHHGISNALQRRYPEAHSLGLVASSTPFVTGHPFTLLQNARVHAAGAVGVALTGLRAPTRLLRFHGLNPLAAPMTVSSCEGNLIHTLDNANPSRLLLTAARDSGLSGDALKEDDFYIGTKDTAGHAGSHPAEVYRITSGDPARGSLALHSDATVAEGSTVQFFHRQSAGGVAVPPAAALDAGTTLGFLVGPTDAGSASCEDKDENEPQCAMDALDTFVACSEHGFVFGSHPGGLDAGRPTAPYRCTVPGGFGALRWRADADAKVESGFPDVIADAGTLATRTILST